MAPALALLASSNGTIIDSLGTIFEVGKTIEFTNGLIVSSHTEIASWAIDYIERHKLLMSIGIVMQVNEQSRILIIAAHPDDEVLAMGGTIAGQSTDRPCESAVFGRRCISPI